MEPRKPADNSRLRNEADLAGDENKPLPDELSPEKNEQKETSAETGKQAFQHRLREEMGTNQEERDITD